MRCGDNSDALFQETLKNIETNIKVVAVIELLKESLEVLEALIPEFFHGATASYEDILKGT